MADADPALVSARRIAAAFASLPRVQAVALGGSRADRRFGEDSDLDLYVYAVAEAPVPLDARRAIAAAYADPRRPVELDNRFWEPGDEWVDAESGLAVDIMYRDPAWIEDEIARVLDRHQASVGYSTALWHNVRRSAPLFDREGWFARLQTEAARPYPDALRRAIVAKNHPLLRTANGAFLRQIEKTLARGDAVAVNHRLAALLASVFDILFALNRETHPGEKRLLERATALPVVPPEFGPLVDDLLRLTAPPFDRLAVVAAAHRLLDGVDALLVDQGLMA